MNFKQALDIMQNGGTVRRTAWKKEADPSKSDRAGATDAHVKIVRDSSDYPNFLMTIFHPDWKRETLTILDCNSILSEDWEEIN